MHLNRGTVTNWSRLNTARQHGPSTLPRAPRCRLPPVMSARHLVLTLRRSTLPQPHLSPDFSAPQPGPSTPLHPRRRMQDIAVDGWALTLLSRRHVGYASTCQTVGMNLGYFTSITVFLALNDADFCNHYLRGPAAASAVGAITLAGYLRTWAVAYVVVTAAVALLKRERPPPPASSMGSLCGPPAVRHHTLRCVPPAWDGAVRGADRRWTAMHAAMPMFVSFAGKCDVIPC